MRRLAYAFYCVVLGVPMIGLVVYMIDGAESRSTRFLWAGILFAYCLGVRLLWRAVLGPVPEESRFERRVDDALRHPVRRLRRLLRTGG
jgi:hypothetical protein